MLRFLASPPLLGWGAKNFSSGLKPTSAALMQQQCLPDKLRGFQLQDGDFNIQNPFQMSAQIYVKYSRLCYH